MITPSVRSRARTPLYGRPESRVGAIQQFGQALAAHGQVDRGQLVRGYVGEVAEGGAVADAGDALGQGGKRRGRVKRDDGNGPRQTAAPLTARAGAG